MTSPAPPVLVLVGTKAQFIKTAPVLKALDARGVGYQLIYTGQHSETFTEIEATFATRPADDNLVPGTEADSAPGLLSWAWKFLWASRARIAAGRWQGARWGVVHGDTASTLLAALVLRIAGVRVAHIEAGLRSPRLLAPFPEELIRRAVSRLSVLHLAPDPAAVANLARVRGRVVDTGGNTLRDALQMASQAIREQGLPDSGSPYAVVSLHRSENLHGRGRFDLLMEEIVNASEALAIKFVLHPVTRLRLERSGWTRRLQAQPGVELIGRLDYVSFMRLLVGARFLMTDGGSNQEEAAMLGLPTLLLRTETERPDGIVQGIVEVSGLDRERIRAFVATRSQKAWTPNLHHPGSSPSAVIADELAAAPSAATD